MSPKQVIVTVARVETDQNMRPLVITAEERRRICTHEAAHAIIWALDPLCEIFSVEISPSGSGVTLGAYSTLLELNKGPEDFAGRKCNSGLMEKVPRRMSKQERARLRGVVHGLMAGRVSEYVLASFSNTEGELGIYWSEDLTIALQYCLVLSPHNCSHEYGKQIKATITLMQNPAIWHRIIALAFLLDQTNSVKGEDLKRFLPAPCAGAGELV